MSENSQTPIVKRIDSICAEFDARIVEVGVPFARAELAKALAEEESRTENFSRCLDRALKLWQAEHPEADFWPDAAGNLAWVFDHLSVVEQDNADLRKILGDAIELAEEGIGYTPEFFQSKWMLKERLEAIKEGVPHVYPPA